MLIIQPEFLFGSGSDINVMCCLLVLIAAMLTSVAMVVMRMLKNLVTNDTALQYFYVGQIVINGMVMSNEGNTSLHY